MKPLIIISCLFTAGIALAVDSPATPQSLAPSAAPAGACVETDTTTGSCWEVELQNAKKSGEACQTDIERFCEGVQVGEGRIEACLKKHQQKLSKACRETLPKQQHQKKKKK